MQYHEPFPPAKLGNINAAWRKEQLEELPVHFFLALLLSFPACELRMSTFAVMQPLDLPAEDEEAEEQADEESNGRA